MADAEPRITERPLYKHLEIEINKTFADSKIIISLEENKWIVRGMSPTVEQAAKIIGIVRANLSVIGNHVEGSDRGNASSIVDSIRIGVE